MEQIRVKGKLIALQGFANCVENREATILLTPPTAQEIADIKNNDYILVKCKVLNALERNFLVDGGKEVFMPIDIKNILAILPQPQQSCLICKYPCPTQGNSNEVCEMWQPKSQQEFCECEIPQTIPNQQTPVQAGYKDDFCYRCHKPIKPLPPDEPIEEFKFSDDFKKEDFGYSLSFKGIDKLNEVIKRLNKQGGVDDQ